MTLRRNEERRAYRGRPEAGRNRTGVAVAPDRTKSMLHEARIGRAGDGGEATHVRVEIQRTAPPPGTMPPMVAPEKETSALLLDKLGERLAFERMGARLYDLLIVKLEASGGFAGGPRRGDLERIRDEELEHFGMLSQTIGSHGGDPTAITPAANLAAVESIGLVQALSDPRTSLADGLHTLLVAELVDEDGWQLLFEVASQLGDHDLAERFERALDQEQDHLDRIRAWIERDVLARA